MARGATPLIISRKSQECIINYLRQCSNMLNPTLDIRARMERIDKVYQRELDYTKEQERAKAANRYGNADKIQNYQVPVVLPQVESAVTYQSSVFLTGTPIFGCVSSPQYADQALQLETKIDNDSVSGGWVREFLLGFRDGAKYNLAAVEVIWDRETTPSLETDVSYGSGVEGKPKEVVWEGNKITRLDLYNTFWDTRVLPTEIHKKGEFVGYNTLETRISLKDYIAKLPDRMVENIKEAFESPAPAIAWSGAVGGAQSYYIPNVNNSSLVQQQGGVQFNWLAWSGLGEDNKKINYRDMYVRTTLYARILPSDFGLNVPSRNTPQIWKFVIINFTTLIYAERQTNAHNLIPVFFSQPNEDGLGYQTKSLAQNVEPIQQISSALMNSMLAARRRAISDRGLYDPSRVTAAHINSDNPSAKIPVRPAAYGKPLNESYYPIPFNDNVSGDSLRQIQLLGAYANVISGQNPAKQGQFVKGNKTLHEYDDVMQHANGRDQMTAMLYEAQWFTPIKLVLKTNILQYQPQATVYNRAREEDITIDPVSLRQAIVNFKVSDGLIPADTLIKGEEFTVALQTIASSPQIGSAYNIGPLFSYLMKTQGADLKEFEKPPAQVQYEQAVGQWQQVVIEMSKNKDIDPSKYPKQPVPQDYGWDPTQQLNLQAAQRN